MNQRTTVRLDPALLRSAKKKAAEEGRTLTSLIEEGLRKVVTPTTAPSHASRNFKLPVSTAGGGNPASIDMRKTSELLAMMDDELPLVKRR